MRGRVPANGTAECIGTCDAGLRCRIMDNAGGLTFYRTSQHHPLLLWAFAAACLTTFEVVNLPDFRRSDTLDPEAQDVGDHWCASLLRLPRGRDLI